MPLYSSLQDKDPIAFTVNQTDIALFCSYNLLDCYTGKLFHKDYKWRFYTFKHKIYQTVYITDMPMSILQNWYWLTVLLYNATVLVFHLSFYVRESMALIEYRPSNIQVNLWLKSSFSVLPWDGLPNASFYCSHLSLIYEKTKKFSYLFKREKILQF